MQEKDLEHMWEPRIKTWWDHLMIQIKGIREKNKRPVLIALSRKMPRFMSWLKSPCADANIDSSILNDIELTTELALPFMFSHINTEKIEFIIVDDIIIHGASLKSVANDLKSLTGLKPHISCICLHQKAVIPDTVDIEDTLHLKRLTQDEVDSFVYYIANIVETYQLPIDLEFPIFNATGLDVDEIWKKLDLIRKSDKIINTYALGPQNEKLCFMPQSSISDKYDYDFKKLRFYYKKSGSNSIALEVFAPSIFSEYTLVGSDIELFEDKEFQNIWNKTTAEIRKRILEFATSDLSVIRTNTRINYIRSLCVWANYLLSLSFFIDTQKDDDLSLSKVINVFHLDKDNLSLLLGKKLCEDILEDLQFLIDNNLSVSSMQRINSPIPESFAPADFKAKMEVEKGRLLIDSKSPEEILKGIFQFQHYANPEFAHPQFAFDRIFFGETYTSLEHALFPFYQEEKYIIEMNKWIDEKIDQGCIVPKYERLTSSSGAVLWRRCFHPGLKKIN